MRASVALLCASAMTVAWGELNPRVARAMKDLVGTPHSYYLKAVEENKPDYLVFVPTQDRQWLKEYEGKPFGKNIPKDPLRPGDTYNDHFQVLEYNGKLFAFWTQATYEGARDQHIAFSRSFDGGETWSKPVVLAGSHCWAVPNLVASWQQPMVSKTGRLYCLWNQQTTSFGPHCGQMMGFYSDNEGDSWSPPKQVPFSARMDQDDKNPVMPPRWCIWQRPTRVGPNGHYFVGCSRHGKAPYDPAFGCKVEFWEYANIDDNPQVGDIRINFHSTNRNALQIAPGAADGREPAVEEASIVKLPDGRLFAVMRSSIGYPVWSQSRDEGRTWTPAKPLLRKDGGQPYLHPRSPCPMYDWKGCEAGSGQYFALIHNTFNFEDKNAYQKRGPLYLIAGRFNPTAEQPVEFSEPKLFAPRKDANSFYASYTVINGKGILWFNDMKFFLLGREIGPEWFEN